MDGDATAEELERLEFEDVPYMPSALEGAAYRFAEDLELACRISELGYRSEVAARPAHFIPWGWPSQGVTLDWGFHEPLDEADQAELAEGRRVLFEDLVRKLKRGELSARGELLRADGLSLAEALLIPTRVWNVCEVDWATNEIAMPDGTRFWIVDVVETEPRGRSAPQSSHGEPPAPRRAPGGKPVLHDWDAFWIEVARYMASKDLRDASAGRGKLQQHLERWCARNMATDMKPGPSNATIRKKLQRLYERLHRSEGAPASKVFNEPTAAFHDEFWIEVVRHADLDGLEKEYDAHLRRRMETWCSNALRDPSSAAAFVPEKLRKLYQDRPVQKRMK